MCEATGVIQRKNVKRTVLNTLDDWIRQLQVDPGTMFGLSRCGRIVMLDAGSGGITGEFSKDSLEGYWYKKTFEYYDKQKEKSGKTPIIGLERFLRYKKEVMKKDWVDINCFCCKHNQRMIARRRGDSYVFLVHCWNPMMKTIEKMEGKSIEHEIARFDYIKEDRRYAEEIFFLEGLRYCYPEPIEFPE